MDAVHIIELELRLQSPAIRQDPQAVAALLSKDFREFGSSGRVYTRPDILAALAAEIPRAILSEDMDCRFLSPELALLTYRSSSSSSSSFSNRSSLRSSLWRLEEESWRIVFH